ncbi:unnamed protein product [Arctogadus glacialis]
MPLCCRKLVDIKSMAAAPSRRHRHMHGGDYGSTVHETWRGGCQRKPFSLPQWLHYSAAEHVAKVTPLHRHRCCVCDQT